jgi:hypothetical protein
MEEKTIEESVLIQEALLTMPLGSWRHLDQSCSVNRVPGGWVYVYYHTAPSVDPDRDWETALPE